MAAIKISLMGSPSKIMIKSCSVAFFLFSIQIYLTPGVASASDELAFADTKHHPKLVDQPDKGILLIARRGMPDPRFKRTVVLLASHDDEGSLGLIINRASQTRLGILLPELDAMDKRGHSIYFGGPVGVNSLKFLVRHNPPPDASLHVMDDLYMSGNQTTLEQMLQIQKSSNELRIYIGYAGWGPGQLDSELDRDDWHLHKASITYVFNSEPGQVWQKLIELYEPEGQMVDRKNRFVPQIWAMNTRPVLR